MKIWYVGVIFNGFSLCSCTFMEFLESLTKEEVFSLAETAYDEIGVVIDVVESDLTGF